MSLVANLDNTIKNLWPKDGPETQKLYKGNITIQSRVTNSGAYSMKKVSFEENKTFDKSNVERFINSHKKKLRK